MPQETVTFVWPGDLHLETADRENYQTARWMVDEVNRLIRPDFVQFAGDNVQHATCEQFALFLQLCGGLQAPYYPLVGDHDAHHDPSASAFQAHLGPTYGAMSLGGCRFIRLNTMEYRTLGISREQTLWFRYEVDSALARGQQVVVFQHHYPYQIWEDFSGPGIDDWREIVQTRRITAIFAGHTHYGQIANDGRNVSIATRSIGDPEGGRPGYSIVHLEGDDLAVTYRTRDDSGPVALVTHPRDVLLALGSPHIVRGEDYCEVRVWAESPVRSVTARIDDAEAVPMQPTPGGRWRAPLPGSRLAKGEHEVEVQATDDSGRTGANRIRFMVDRSGRYTAYPRVRPEVSGTQFC
jgi:predicted phosphodiesterase